MSVDEYRFGQNIEPTDEQLAAIMAEAAELARASSRRVREIHLRRLRDGI